MSFRAVARNPYKVQVGQLSDPGVTRGVNEDSLGVFQPSDPDVAARKGWLYLVADGMGGHAAGKTASELAIQSIAHAYFHDPSPDVEESLTRAIRQSNAEIHARSEARTDESGMGTTVVALVIGGSEALIANVGDSRAYRLRNGQIEQLTRDHSWVAQQVREGTLTEVQARAHPYRSTITRALGMSPGVKVDVARCGIRHGDAFILCTDGLTSEVRDREVAEVVAGHAPQAAAVHLVSLANQRGASDNVTVLVVRVPPASNSRLAALPEMARTVGWRPALGGLAVLALILVVLLAAMQRPPGTQSSSAARPLAVSVPTATASPTATPTPSVTPSPSPTVTPVPPTATLRPLPGQKTSAMYGRVIADELWVFPTPDATLSCQSLVFRKLPKGTRVEILQLNRTGVKWCDTGDFCQTRHAPPENCDTLYHSIRGPNGEEGWVWSRGVELEN